MFFIPCLNTPISVRHEKAMRGLLMALYSEYNNAKMSSFHIVLFVVVVVVVVAKYYHYFFVFILDRL